MHMRRLAATTCTGLDWDSLYPPCFCAFFSAVTLRAQILASGQEEQSVYLKVENCCKHGWVFQRGLKIAPVASENSIFCSYGFVVSKETVVLRRWERSKQKFGFIT